MAKSHTKTSNTEVRNPYSIHADNGEVVNVRESNPNRTIQIHGHRIKVKDIPITAALLDCGHTIRGIAFQPGNLVYCDKHEGSPYLQATVVEVY